MGRGAAPCSDARRDIGARLFRFHRSPRPGRGGRNSHDAGPLHPQRAPPPGRRHSAERQAGAVRARTVGRRAPSRRDECHDRTSVEGFGEGAARDGRDAGRRGIGVHPGLRGSDEIAPPAHHDAGGAICVPPRTTTRHEEVRQDPRWGRRGAKPQAPGAKRDHRDRRRSASAGPHPADREGSITARVDVRSSAVEHRTLPPRSLVRAGGPQVEDHLNPAVAGSTPAGHPRPPVRPGRMVSARRGGP
jgi:hypothetical protein